MLGAPARAVDGDEMGVVEEAVEDGGGHGLVAEGLLRGAAVEVRCDDGRAALVAAVEELEDERHALVGRVREAEILDDEDIDSLVEAEAVSAAPRFRTIPAM